LKIFLLISATRKENSRGVNSSKIYLIHFKNFCKCHNVPPPSTTIKKGYSSSPLLFQEVIVRELGKRKKWRDSRPLLISGVYMFQRDHYWGKTMNVQGTKCSVLYCGFLIGFSYKTSQILIKTGCLSTNLKFSLYHLNFLTFTLPFGDTYFNKVKGREAAQSHNWNTNDNSVGLTKSFSISTELCDVHAAIKIFVFGISFVICIYYFWLHSVKSMCNKSMNRRLTVIVINVYFHILHHICLYGYGISRASLLDLPLEI
jgi:hypothetical protein